MDTWLTDKQLTSCVSQSAHRPVSRRRLGGRPLVQLQVHGPVVAHDAAKVFDRLEVVGVCEERLALGDEGGEHARHVGHLDVGGAERHLEQTVSVGHRRHWVIVPTSMSPQPTQL